MQTYESQPAPSTRSQRKLRNYLLDRSFQLKYANFCAGIALLLSSALGLLLWNASEATVSQSRAAVALGAEVLTESRKVSEVVAMNIVKDPVYSDNPGLQSAFQADAENQAKVLGSQQARLEAQAANLERSRRQFGLLLVASLAAAVVLLWMGGIVLTHRVAGPIYKMKRQMRALQRGNWMVPGPLRRGDDLKEFFDAFNEMVGSLRSRRESELHELEEILESLPSSGNDAARLRLTSLRNRLQEVLK
jgi:nitrogen fixation/metabolism regulation signal transduction histidine kinase